jgi:hypothetical protein
MRTAVVFLLFTALAAPLLVGTVWPEVERYQVQRAVKWRMAAGLSDEQLTRLVFAKKDLQTALRWEHEREFEYGGEMYDVVRREERGDSVALFCWHDREETVLNTTLRERVFQVLHHDPTRQERQQTLVFFFKTLFWEKPERPVFLPVFEKNERVNGVGCAYASRTPEPPGEPPERGRCC